MSTEPEPVYAYVPGKGWVIQVSAFLRTDEYGRTWYINVEKRDVKHGERCYWVDPKIWGNTPEEIASCVGWYGDENGGYGWKADRNIRHTTDEYGTYIVAVTQVLA